jgi:hypothetical protein
MKARSRYSSIPIKRSSGRRTQRTAEQWRETAILAELKKAAGPKVRAKMGSFDVHEPKAQGISVHYSSPSPRGTLDGSGCVARVSEALHKKLGRKQR